MKENNRIFLIDGMAMIYRAHFAMIRNPLTTKDGRHTSAVYGFFNSLFKIIKQESPDYLAIVLDSKEPTFRHKLYDEYKANRKKMPDELSAQIPIIEEAINAANIPIVKKPGFEADDLMGAIAKLADGYKTYIVTGDKDMMQVVSDRVFVYSPETRFRPQTLYDVDEVQKKWGVHPEQIIDLLTLVGDSSDNIPGVDGVGAKTAAKLINQYETIDNILNNIENIPNKRVQKGFEGSRDQIDLSKKLVSIDCDVDPGCSIDEMQVQSPDIDKLSNLFKDLEIHSLLNNIKQAHKLEKDIPEQTQDSKNKNYQVIYTLAELGNLVELMYKSDIVSVDIESTHINPNYAKIVGISVSVEKDTGHYIPFVFPGMDSDDKYTLSSSEILDILKPVLESDEVSKCGQNIKYDMLIFLRYGITLKGILFDTMIAEHILHPEKNSYKLENLSVEYFGYRMQPIEELIGEGKDQQTMDLVPLDKVMFYACEDADVTLQLTQILKKSIDETSMSRAFYDIEIPLISALAQIEYNGVFIDKEELSKLHVDVSERLERLKGEVFGMSGREFNINSPKQLSEILFDELELKEIKKRSTAVNVLEVLKNHHPLPGKILDYRHLSKLNSTYINALPDHINVNTGRVHTSLNQTIVATGRLSSTSPNFQNIPIRTKLGKEIRKAFKGQEGCHILSADYSQVELRIMAHFSKEPELVDAFNDNVDVHRRTAALVYGVSEEDVSDDQRRTAKVVNFGIMYGAGPFRMSQELGISMSEAKGLIGTYFNTYPGIRIYIDTLLDNAREDGFVETLFGRRRMAYNLNSDNMNIQKAEERALVNMPIQGTAAELIKLAMINIQHKILKNSLDSRMILQVHDELLFEIPENEIDIMVELVKFEMENAIKLDVPLTVEYNFGKSWYDAH